VSLLELAVAAAVGGAAGWAGHALYRWARPAPATPFEEVPAAIGPSPSSPPRVETPSAPPQPRRLSDGASAARRLILHLYAQGRLAPHEVADPEFTQEGIGRALNLRQGTVARVVGRLAATGVLASDRRHVSGRPRRLIVYTLTPLGESVARDLRKSAVPAGDPSRPEASSQAAPGNRT
jgi:DNA-binding MarR family transcriptional regulator